mgnify:CR=1 FL=1
MKMKNSIQSLRLTRRFLPAPEGGGFLGEFGERWLAVFSFIDQRMSVNERCHGKKPPSRKFSCFIAHKVI